MEFASLLLLILLPASDAGTDMTAAIQAALYRDLGQVAIAVAPDTASSRKSWQEANGDYRAKYVTRFTWSRKHKARVELWRGQGVGDPKDRLGMREITFSPSDATAERGRALGLVVVQLMRELPEADLGMPKPTPQPVVIVEAPPAPTPSPRGHAAVALLSFSRAASGVWTYGPEIVASLHVLPHVSVQASIAFGQGSENGYSELGPGLGAAYFPWQSSDLRQGVGLGLRLGLYRESAQTGHEPPVTMRNWEVAATPQVLGYFGIWRQIQAHAAVGLRRDTGTFSTEVGDDSDRMRFTYSAWRPSFSLGLGLAF